MTEVREHWKEQTWPDDDDVAETDVPTGLTAIDDAIDALESEVSMLSERLDPVLRQEPPPPPVEARQGRGTVSGLRDRAGRIRQLRDQVKTLNDRLDV